VRHAARDVFRRLDHQIPSECSTPSSWIVQHAPCTRKCRQRSQIDGYREENTFRRPREAGDNVTPASPQCTRKEAQTDDR
jgi:hypothetical protein